MKCKIVSLALVVAMLMTMLVLSNVQPSRGAQSNGRIKFLRPLQQRSWLRRPQQSLAQAAGRSDAGTGRGLMKHLMLFKNLWQQPSSNVIIITRPTTTQNDGTTTTATNTNAPTGTATRSAPLRPRLAADEGKADAAIVAANNIDDIDDADVDVNVNDRDMEIHGTRTAQRQNFQGVSGKISMAENMQENATARRRQTKRNKNKRNKRRHNVGNQQAKRRKQIIDVDKILKREEERRNNGQRTTMQQTQLNANDGGNFMRLMNSFHLQPSVVY